MKVVPSVLDVARDRSEGRKAVRGAAVTEVMSLIVLRASSPVAPLQGQDSTTGVLARSPSAGRSPIRPRTTVLHAVRGSRHGRLWTCFT